MGLDDALDSINRGGLEKKKKESETEVLPPDTWAERRIEAERNYRPSGTGIPLFSRWESEAKQHDANSMESHSRLLQSLNGIQDAKNEAFEKSFFKEETLDRHRKQREQSDLQHRNQAIQANADAHLIEAARSKNLDRTSYGTIRQQQEESDVRIREKLYSTQMDIDRESAQTDFRISERNAATSNAIDQLNAESRNRRVEAREASDYRVREETHSSRLRRKERQHEVELQTKYEWEQVKMRTHERRADKELELDLKVRQMEAQVRLALQAKSLGPHQEISQLINLEDEMNHQIFEIKNSNLHPKQKERMIRSRENYLEFLEEDIHGRRQRLLEARNRGDVRGDDTDRYIRERLRNSVEGSPKQLPAKGAGNGNGRNGKHKRGGKGKPHSHNRYDWRGEK